MQGTLAQAAPTQDDAALQMRVRSWLHQELQDAEENRREWRLLCVQAEAELRNLRSQVSIDSVTPEVCSPASTSPTALRRLGETSPDRDSPRSGNSPSNLIIGDGLSLSGQTEVELALAKVLAMERHIAGLNNLIATVETDTDAVRESTADLEAGLRDMRAAAREASQRASTAGSDVLAIVASQTRARAEHADKCELLVEEARLVFANAAPGKVVAAELESVKATERQMLEVARKLEDDIEVIARRRECLWMSREEAIARRRDFVESHSQSTRDTAAARLAAQERAAALSRLQGQVLRTRSKSERKRRLLEGQLVQCRGELADAMGKVNTAGDKLRKLKQQQGKQLRELRSETDGLQSEVSRHLSAIETSEADTRDLHMEEAELENDRSRHLNEEFALEERASSFRQDVTRMRHEVAAQEATGQLSLAQLRSGEEELAEEEHVADELQAEVRALIGSTEATEASTEEFKSQLREEHKLCSLQAEEVEKLEALEAKVDSLKAKNAGLTAEHSKLQESAKRCQKDSEKHVADLQEATKRLSRLRAHHDELADPTTSKGREALLSTMDQSLSRAGKKADAVVSALDTSGPGSAGNRSARSNDTQVALTQRSPSALQQRLQAEHERHMETSLAEERRKVVAEQQRSLTEARQRSSALQKARQDRRNLQEQLSRCQQSLEWSRRSSELELIGLEAQVKIVDREATEGVDTVTAEFSDLLQKQALERDLLQAQVEELRGQIDEIVTRAKDKSSSTKVEEEEAGMDELLDVPIADLLQRLAREEKEADKLRAEEEEWLQANVKLKAAVVASRQQLQEGPGKLQPLYDIVAAHEKKLPRPATGRVTWTRSPTDTTRPAVKVTSSDSPIVEPKTPPKANERHREGNASPAPLIVCTSDAQEEVHSLDTGSWSVISPQHRRVVSNNTNTVSSIASSAVPEHIGLSGSYQSVSSHSASTPVHAQNVPAAMLVRTVAEASRHRSNCTWPSGMRIPNPQERPAVDPRSMGTFG
jgi:hypothetical protein